MRAELLLHAERGYLDPIICELVLRFSLLAVLGDSALHIDSELSFDLHFLVQLSSLQLGVFALRESLGLEISEVLCVYFAGVVEVLGFL